MPFSPSKDGVDHINVYSKGKTALGRELSNFAHTPFTMPNIGAFASVEAWWYWSRNKREEMRNLYGYQAKQAGRLYPIVDFTPITEERVIPVYRAKLDANPLLKRAVRDNMLPFDHYFVYNDQRKETIHQWTGTLWNKIADYVR